mmetsp:Transcript_17722/g.59380  ORF Transcript_17722/g.59380 Transcript_17722/m.59380 type:complete len:303 (-) Transcript_17722:134-1042(-)
MPPRDRQRHATMCTRYRPRTAARPTRVRSLPGFPPTADGLQHPGVELLGLGVNLEIELHAGAAGAPAGAVVLPDARDPLPGGLALVPRHPGRVVREAKVRAAHVRWKCEEPRDEHERRGEDLCAGLVGGGEGRVAAPGHGQGRPRGRASPEGGGGRPASGGAAIGRLGRLRDVCGARDHRDDASRVAGEAAHHLAERKLHGEPRGQLLGVPHLGEAQALVEGRADAKGEEENARVRARRALADAVAHEGRPDALPLARGVHEHGCELVRLVRAGAQGPQLRGAHDGARRLVARGDEIRVLDE